MSENFVVIVWCTVLAIPGQHLKNYVNQAPQKTILSLRSPGHLYEDTCYILRYIPVICHTKLKKTWNSGIQT